jgi:hypothetical protein
LGEALLVGDQVQLHPLNELNAWNQAKFAAHPEGQKKKDLLSKCTTTDG